jgi:hypothetical protein
MNSMEQSPFWEAESRSASQEIPTFLITVLTKSRHWTLSWAFSISVLDAGGWSASRPFRFIPRKELPVHTE